jgi:uncharacterized protein YjiS (DUF1127 family)
MKPRDISAALLEQASGPSDTAPPARHFERSSPWLAADSTTLRCDRAAPLHVDAFELYLRARRLRAQRLGDLLSRMVTRCLETLGDWHQRSLARRRLGELDDRMLRDIGLDRDQVQIETRKPFWHA